LEKGKTTADIVNKVVAVVCVVSQKSTEKNLLVVFVIIKFIGKSNVFSSFFVKTEYFVMMRENWKMFLIKSSMRRPCFFGH